MANVTRRQFGKAAAAVWMTTAAGSRRVRGANDRMRLGFIGLGNRGDQVLDAFLVHQDAEVARHLRHLPAVPRLRRAERWRARHSACKRLPRAARHEGRRCRRHLHAGPLARAADDSRVPGRQGRLRREAAVARASTRDARWWRRPAEHNRVVQVGIHRRSSVFVQGGRRSRAERRARQGHGRPRPSTSRTSGRRASAIPAGRRAAGRLRLGRVARPRPEARLQQEPHLLPVPLVLRLLGRAGHQLRRPLPGCDPVGARARRAAGGDGDGRQVRRSRTTARSPTRSKCSGRIPGGTLVTFSQFNATAAPPARDSRVRDRVPRHEGDAVPVRRRLRGGAGRDHAERVSRTHAGGPTGPSAATGRAPSR